MRLLLCGKKNVFLSQWKKIWQKKNKNKTKQKKKKKNQQQETAPTAPPPPASPHPPPPHTEPENQMVGPFQRWDLVTSDRWCDYLNEHWDNSIVVGLGYKPAFIATW